MIEKGHDYDNDREVSPFVFHIEDVKSFDIKNKKGENGMVRVYGYFETKEVSPL